MKKSAVKKTGAPPLLCWDIYSNWLNEKFGIGTINSEKIQKKKTKEL